MEPQTRQAHPSIHRGWLSWLRDLARLALALAVTVGLLAAARAIILFILDPTVIYVFVLTVVVGTPLLLIARVAMGALFCFITNRPMSFEALLLLD